MKPDRLSLAVIAAALLAVPFYSAAQQATPAVPVASQAPGTAEASKAPAVGKAPATAPEAGKAAAAVEAGTASGAAADAGKAPAGAAEASPAPTVDPEAAAALKRTSEYLQTLKTFNLRVDSSTDQVLDSGQKIQMGSVADISVIKPDRLRVDLVADDRQRQFYYDGKTLTLYGKLENYYASVKAPGTIREMLDFAETKYGLEWPLADLLAPESLAQNVKSGIYLGKSRVGGTLCDHYAFRQDDVDWQIWIQDGKTPLPRKIVITTKGAEGAPQHASVLSWNLAPKLPESAFRFIAPKSAHKIVFRELDSQPGNKN